MGRQDRALSVVILDVGDDRGGREGGGDGEGETREEDGLG
jgi:hypothetical protein